MDDTATRDGTGRIALGAALVALVSLVQAFMWHGPRPPARAGAHAPGGPVGACQRRLDGALETGPVTFLSNGATIDPARIATVDAVAVAMRGCGAIAAEVGGHTDGRGDTARNLRLSQQRAQAVVDALIARGIAPARLIARGFGETRPAVAGSGVEANAANRRITFTAMPPVGVPAGPGVATKRGEHP